MPEDITQVMQAHVAMKYTLDTVLVVRTTIRTKGVG
jgi:hypothetical protein